MGLVSFTIFAALTAAIDSSAIAFFVLRAVQGICAAATIPTAYALVANLYDGKRRELAVAGLGACQAIGAAIGTIRKLVIRRISLKAMLTYLQLVALLRKLRLDIGVCCGFHLASAPFYLSLRFFYSHQHRMMANLNPWITSVLL
jgi:MFS family permease